MARNEGLIPENSNGVDDRVSEQGSCLTSRGGSAGSKEHGNDCVLLPRAWGHWAVGT